MQLRQENRTKDIIQIEKEEIKLSLFAGDMIVYVEKPKESTKKQSLELLSNYPRTRGLLPIEAVYELI